MLQLEFDTSKTAIALLAGLGISYITARRIFWRSGGTLPPGPPAWPIVGNILSFSPRDAYKVLARYKDAYGDVVMIHGLGTHILVLNNMDVVDDLLVKRAEFFSHRPKLVFAGELMEMEKSTPLIQYGAGWRAHRRMMHSTMNANAVKEYHRTQERLAVRLCVEMADEPTEYFQHIALFAGRVALAVIYGIEVPDRHDYLIRHVEMTMRFVSEVTVPGAFLCDVLPFFKHLPSWLPFQRKAAYGRALVDKNMIMPLERVRAGMAAGTAPPSLARYLLSGEEELTDSYLSLVKWVGGSLYGPASETTAATIIIFLMGMVLNPDAQKAAQDEIHRVIGPSRLPTIADKDDLPYINALIKETMRWRPVLPLGLARRSEGDVLYRDYFIPHDTIVLPNVWSIAHEPNAKYDPALFLPERFLDPTQSIVDPITYAFGFGRRLCPGKHLAHNSVFIGIVTILWMFEISLKPGTTFEPRFSPDLVCYPKPFPCDIKPRSLERVEMLRKVVLSSE